MAALKKVLTEDTSTFVRVAAGLLPKEEEHERRYYVIETWRDRELMSRSATSQGPGSSHFTTEQNALPALVDLDGNAIPCAESGQRVSASSSEAAAIRKGDNVIKRGQSRSRLGRQGYVPFSGAGREYGGEYS
jgi:hypothetical protein